MPNPDRTASMDRDQRWSALLGLLGTFGRLTVAQVSADLGVSEATVRRDFAALAEQQLATRTHGGVVATAVAYELPARYKNATTDSAKERVARTAAGLVPVGAVVGLNGGTTTSATARHLGTRADLAESSARPALTVVTNALNIATELVLRPYIRCVTLGGVARPESYEVTGPLARMVLEQLWLDVVIIGVEGIAAVGGATCRQEGEAGISALMVARSEKVIVAATGDKVGIRTFARICEADRTQVLVTDLTAAARHLDALRAVGVHVIIA